MRGAGSRPPAPTPLALRRRPDRRIVAVTRTEGVEGPRRSSTSRAARRRVQGDTRRGGWPAAAPGRSIGRVRLSRAVAPRSIRQRRTTDVHPALHCGDPTGRLQRDHDGLAIGSGPGGGPGRQPRGEDRRTCVPGGAHREAAGHQAPRQETGRSQEPCRQGVEVQPGAEVEHHGTPLPGVSQGSSARVAPPPGHSRGLASNVATMGRATEASGRCRDARRRPDRRRGHRQLPRTCGTSSSRSGCPRPTCGGQARFSR